MGVKIHLPVIMVIILTGLIFLIWNRGNSKQEEIMEEIKVPVITSRPVDRTLERRISFRSFVESDHTVAVYPQTVGILQSVAVEEGQRVSAGQLIALLDNESLRLNMNQAEASLKLAQEDINRYKTIYEKSLISEQQYQQIETNYKATVARYELARVQYEYSRVKSPIDGVVQIVNVEPGVLVSSQVNLMSIAARGTKIIKADVPEKYYEYFQDIADLPVEIIRPGNAGMVYVGQIEYVSPFISRGTMKFQVTVKLDDGETLIPGMYMELSFVLDRRENVLSLPYSALTRAGKLWYADSDSKVHSFEPADIFEGDMYFAVSEDLRSRDIIVEGQHFLTEGQEVRVQDWSGY